MVEMSVKFGSASPPLDLISSTICSAGVFEVPSPSNDAPRSFTITLAPSEASCLATPAPIPRPAPVTIATFPSK